MKEKVIYTCIVGGYDQLKQPLVIYEEYDYICFSDNSQQSQDGIWKILPIPYQTEDNTRRARFIKHNPHIVLPEYKYSIWIDSNIQIIDNLLEQRVEELIASGSIIAQITHPFRNCVYEEAKQCIIREKDNKQDVIRLISLIKSKAYPRKNGLTETNVIFRVHNNTSIIKFSEEWWYYILNYSKRDQLSCNYIIWKHKLKVDELLPKNINTYSTNHFKRHIHVNEVSIITRFKLKCRYYYNLLRLIVGGENKFL